jgi:hypothetical protein
MLDYSFGNKHKLFKKYIKYIHKLFNKILIINFFMPSIRVKRMKKILLAMLLSVFLFSAMTVPSMSQDVTVGVSVGDWFIFEATILEWIAEPDVPFPPDQYMTILYTFNETDWEKYTVTDVSGGYVTFEIVTHWKNGTEPTSEQTIEIASIENFRFIPANLESGDLLRDEFTLFGLLHYPPQYLNDSVLVDYETETREANVLDYEQPTLYPEDSVHTRSLWDKETGVLIKSQNVYNNTSALGQKFFVRYEIELVEANLWVIPEFPTGTAMLLIFVAVTVCVEVYRRKKLKVHIG